MFTLDFLNQVANGLEKDSMLVALSLPTSLPSFIIEQSKVPIVHLMIFYPCGNDVLVRTCFSPC